MADPRPAPKRSVNTDPTVEILENGEVEKGNPEEFAGEAILVFLDLLGFANATGTNWKDGLDSALCRLLLIKEKIPQTGKQVAFALYTRDDMSDRITYNCRLQTISDSMIISVALPPGCRTPEFLLAFTVIYSQVWQTWRESILQGFTVRGGVELGEVFWDAGDVTGPVVVEACGLEAKVASSSRIIVGNGLTDRLLEISQTRDLAADMLTPLPYLHREDDGEICISPHALIGSNRRDSLGVIPKLLALQQQCTEPGLRAKYDGLLSLLRDPDRIITPTLDDLTPRRT